MDDGDRVALVTGAASGIGRATALAFADAGARLVLADVQDEAGDALAAQIRERDGAAEYVHADMSDPREVEAMIQRALTTFGRLDAAFNNAGIEGEVAPTGECPPENWDRVIAVNLTGVFHCMRHELRAMGADGGGAIVNCSSVAGRVGFPGIPAYVASKHALIGLTRTAALEYAPAGIRVNAVCPGVIDTPMVTRFTDGDPDALAALTASEPVGRIGRPEEVAAAVVWLCSPQAGFVTGEALAVDGGYLAR